MIQKYVFHFARHKMCSEIRKAHLFSHLVAMQMSILDGKILQKDDTNF